MICFWIQKKNRPCLKFVAGALVGSLFLNFIAPALLQASFWQERQNAMKNLADKQDKTARAFNGTALSTKAEKSLSQTAAFGIEIPQELGRIIEGSEGNGDFRDLPLVIHIQDAHGVYGAQKNTASILKLLAEERGASSGEGQSLLICVEGAWERVTPEWLKAFPDEAVKKDVAESFLERGEMTGEEYFAALNLGEKIQIEGVEEREIYEANLKARNWVNENREIILARCSLNQERLERLKKVLYEPPLLKVSWASVQFDSQKISLKEYFNTLKKISPSNPKTYPHLAILEQVMNLEDSISARKVESERENLLKVLGKKLDQQVLYALARASLNLRAGKISSLHYHQELARLAGIYGIPAPSIESYVLYLKKAQEADISSVMKELSSLEKSVFLKLAGDLKPVKELARMDRVNREMRKSWSERFSPQDWGDYGEKPMLLRDGAREIEEYLDREERRLGIAAIRTPPVFSREERENMIFLQESYYQLAFKRDKTMVENTLKKAREAGREKGVLLSLIHI